MPTLWTLPIIPKVFLIRYSLFVYLCAHLLIVTFLIYIVYNVFDVLVFLGATFS